MFENHVVESRFGSVLFSLLFINRLEYLVCKLRVTPVRRTISRRVSILVVLIDSWSTACPFLLHNCCDCRRGDPPEGCGQSNEEKVPIAPEEPSNARRMGAESLTSATADCEEILLNTSLIPLQSATGHLMLLPCRDCPP